MNGEEGSVGIFIFLQILQLLRSKVSGKMNAQERIYINGGELNLEYCTSISWKYVTQIEIWITWSQKELAKPHSQMPKTVYVLVKDKEQIQETFFVVIIYKFSTVIS
jgi:hypothetical protein